MNDHILMTPLGLLISRFPGESKDQRHVAFICSFQDLADREHANLLHICSRGGEEVC